MQKKITKSKHKGREVRIKENGLPAGHGLYWHDSKRLYIYAKVGGERFSCNTKDWREALDFVEAEREKQKKREAGLVFGEVLISDLLDDLIQYYEGRSTRRGKYKTGTAYIAGITINMTGGVRDTFGKLKASKLRPNDYTEYRDRWTALYVSQGKKANKVQYTIDHHLSYVRRAITLAVEHEKVSRDTPLPKIDKQNSLNGARHGIITDEQAVALIDTLPDWASVGFAICYATGIRKKEVTFIERSDTKLPFIDIQPSQTKQGKTRTHGIPDTILALVTHWEEKTRREFPRAEYLLHRDGAQLTVDLLTDAFNKACETLGYHKPILNDQGEPVRYMGREIKMDRSAVRWHDSRRSAITEVSSIPDLSSQDVQKGMGISHETQAKYSQNQSAPARILEALNRKHARNLERTLQAVATPVVETLSQTLQTATATANQTLQAPAGQGGTDRRSKLVELKALFDDGLIDSEEYKDMKKALLVA